MASITSAGSGNWSSEGTWSGGVPANGDTVTIQAGHTVTFDVDQSGFASGLEGLAINGTLTFKNDGTVTYLKMAGNITGSGSLYVGTQANPIPAPTPPNLYVATIAFNGAYQITGNLANLELWGEEREAYSTTVGSKGSGDNTIVLASPGLNLRQGDLLYLSYPTAGTNATTHTVSSYDSGTRTVTLSTTLGRTVAEGTGVTLDTRNILCTNLGKASNTGFVNAKNNGKANGVRFFNFARGPIDSRTGWVLRYCTGNNNGAGGLFYFGSSSSAHKCVGNSNSSGGICNNSSGQTISYTVTNNTTTGGITYYGSAVTISNCILNNNSNGGVCHYGFGHRILNTVTNNSTYGSSAYGAGHVFYMCQGNNNSNAWIDYRGVNNTFISCTEGTNSSGSMLVSCKNCKLYNCSGSSLVTGYSTVFNLQSDRVEHFNGNDYSAWMNGGRITTESGNMVLNCESATTPVFRDYSIPVVSGERVKVMIGMQKSIAGITAGLQLIGPATDPYIDSSNSPLSSAVMTNDTDKQILSVSLNNMVTRQLIARVYAMNSTGTVTVSTPRRAVYGAGKKRRRVRL